MYLNDFDNNGSLDQVICSYQNGISYPFASLDELSAQITGLEKKFPRYSDFGNLTVKEIFGENAIKQSMVKKAELFESCVFLNNRNGKQDLVLAGNDYAVRPSYGRYDASYGWCLLGEKDNKYKALLPVNSGLKIIGDARKIVPIDIAGKHYIIAAVNNGELQVFQLLK